MYLTKTDFIHYLRCSKSLWLLKHKPDIYPHREFSEFLQKITREGYEVEEYAQQLFPNGISLPSGSAATERTQQAIADKTPVMFQATFLTDDGMYVRTDILERNDDNTYTLYEVKSSTAVKRDKKHNHIKDACFQMIALEKAGLTVRDVYIIHMNPEYLLDGEVNPHALLKKSNVTEQARAMEAETRAEVGNALALLRADAIDETGCGCYRKTRSNHCDAFEYFNNEPREHHSVWNLARISEKKLCTLLDCGVTKIAEVPEGIALNTHQTFQVESARIGEPKVADARIREMLSSLVFPLYFFDYETAMHAVPRVPGMKPWQQLPFQFSLHKMDEDGAVTHEEHLSDTLHGIDTVLDALCERVGPEGSVISWHASFEKSRNREMGNVYPRYQDALQDINNRMFDLEDIFKESYVDSAFRGSTSIKKVLPVLCPHLSYADLAVRDGTQAMERWLVMVDEGTDTETRADIRRDLLEYCKLDTYAMVELYRTLRGMV